MNNKCALITGASDRLGKEMAIYLAKKQYDIVIHYNSSADKASDLLNFLKKNYQINGAIFQADFNDISAINKLSEFVINNFPKWNLLINNSSIFNYSNFNADLHNELNQNLMLHLIAPIHLSHSFNQYVLSQKIADAQIINMLDKNIARYDTEYFYYLLTKKFLAEFTKMLSLQLAPNIRVNGIAPGLILKDKDKSEDNNQKIIDKIPLKRKGNPENIIQTLDFLINNNFVNGQIISIDGGASLNHAG